MRPPALHSVLIEGETPGYLHSSAVFSKPVDLEPPPRREYRYRYSLQRAWGMDPKWICFVGVNPSTASAFQDDQTIRRCVDYAQHLGFDRLNMLNLYAYRSKDVRALTRVEDPVGPENRGHLLHWLDCTIRTEKHHHVGRWICAWGNHGTGGEADWFATAALERGIQLGALRITQKGEPLHPSRAPSNLVPVEYLRHTHIPRQPNRRAP